MSEAAIHTKSSRSWEEFFCAASIARFTIVALLVLLVYWGTIRSALIARWISDGNWSHGWLIPLFSLYFLYVHRDDLLRCRPRPSYVGALIVALSLAIYFVSAWRLRMKYPQALSIIGTMIGLTLLMGGWSVLRVLWFPIVFLLLAIPLPQEHYVTLTMPLRKLASQVSAMVMPLLSPGLHTEAQSVVIDYILPGRPPGQLNVEEACSGMHLMMTFVTLGVAIAYLGDRRPWQRVVMLVSCVPIAVFCNALRVIITGLLHIHGLQQWATGTPHQLLGILMVPIALGCFALMGYVLSHLFVEVNSEIASDRMESSNG